MHIFNSYQHLINWSTCDLSVFDEVMFSFSNVAGQEMRWPAAEKIMDEKVKRNITANYFDFNLIIRM